MILTTIPELLDIVRQKYDWKDGEGSSFCPVCKCSRNHDFRFSNHLGRCFECGWIGDQTELAKDLELYPPNSRRSLPDVTSQINLFAPDYTFLEDEFQYAKGEIVRAIDEMREANRSEDLSFELYITEEYKRWSIYLQYVEMIIALRDGILLKGDDDECK